MEYLAWFIIYLFIGAGLECFIIDPIFTRRGLYRQWYWLIFSIITWPINGLMGLVFKMCKLGIFKQNS